MIMETNKITSTDKEISTDTVINVGTTTNEDSLDVQKKGFYYDDNHLHSWDSKDDVSSEGYLNVPKNCKFTFLRLKEANATILKAGRELRRMLHNMANYVAHMDKTYTTQWDIRLDADYDSTIYHFATSVELFRNTAGLNRLSFYQSPYSECTGVEEMPATEYIEAYKNIVSVLVAAELIEMDQNAWDMTNLIKEYRTYDEYRNYTY